MPIWLRTFHINKISEWNKKQNEENQKAQKGKNPSSNKPMGPNITPSSTYNF